MSGALYYLLGNRIYLGEIVHKGKAHPGNHDPIISHELWENVQAIRKENRYEYRHCISAQERSLLAGKLYDADGLAMTPSHSNKQGKRYRYYINRAKLLGKVSSANTIGKVPANEIEMAVALGIKNLLHNEKLAKIVGPLSIDQRQKAQDLVRDWNSGDSHTIARDVVTKVVLEHDRLVCHIIPAALHKLLGSVPTDVAAPYILHIPIRVKRVMGGATMMLNANGDPSRAANSSLTTAVAKGYIWNQLLVTGKVKNMKALVTIAEVDDSYIRKLLSLAWLAPDVVEAVMEGREPEHIKLMDLLKVAPLSWEKQRAKLRMI